MFERLKVSLSGMWLFVCVFILLIPVFLPSVAGSANPASNVIGAATASMFILTFPSSLFGLPLLVFTGSMLGIEPNSISGMYLNLFVMFILGLVQWFWIAPRIWKWETKVQVLDIPVNTAPLRPLTFVPADVFQPYDDRDRTPLERIIRDESERAKRP
jgi:hypothetical protein